MGAKTTPTTLDEFVSESEAGTQPKSDAPPHEERCVAIAEDTGRRCQNSRTSVEVCGKHLTAVNDIVLIEGHEPSALLEQLVSIRGVN